MKPRAIILISIIAAALFLSGCGYMKMSFKRAHAKRWDSLRAQKAAYPESNFIVIGRVHLDQQSNVPVAVVAVSDDLRKDEVVDMVFMNTPSFFTLYLPPGKYRLVVFADLNANRRFETEEAVGRYGADDVLVLSGETGGVIEDVQIKADLTSPFVSGFRFNKRIRGNLPAMDISGITKSLDDQIFSQRMGEIGLYDPANFMRRTQSMLYTVEGDTTRIPVIFVHGITGTPANWKHISERLPEGFHPWFYYYPSGESLEKSAELLYYIVDEVLPFDYMVIVSHSMGGLVARAAIDKYERERRSDYLRMFVSIATPYGGVEKATAALRSDVSAPSWLDLVPGSEFLERYSTNGVIPKHAEFHLIFAYSDDGGECSDGTVSLRSQLAPRTEALASSVFGYEETHVGLLSSNAVSDRLNALLNTVSGKE